jgi:hypothetical protein
MLSLLISARFDLRPRVFRACRHLRVIASEDLFHQNSSIGKLSRLAVILSRARRRIRVVHLGAAVEINHRIRSKRR